MTRVVPVTKSIFAVALAFLLAGCALRVESTVTAFHVPSFKADNSLVWVTANASSPLEGEAYASLVAAHLKSVGFKTITEKPQSAPRYIAVLTFGIDNGQYVTQTYAIPHFGRTGYSGSTTTGTISTLGSMSTLSTSTSYMPTYGVTGYSTGVSTTKVFDRKLVLGIYDFAELKRGDTESAKRAAVYLGSVDSSGTCGSITAVMKPLLDALFLDFPGPSGSTQVRTVRMDRNAC